MASVVPDHQVSRVGGMAYLVLCQDMDPLQGPRRTETSSSMIGITSLISEWDVSQSHQSKDKKDVLFTPRELLFEREDRL